MRQQRPRPRCLRCLHRLGSAGRALGRHRRQRPPVAVHLIRRRGPRTPVLSSRTPLRWQGQGPHVHRERPPERAARAMLVALGGFLGMYFVPFVKYPANPPAIGHAETIRDRGNLYLGMVACSVLFLVLAVWLGKRLQARFGNWNATLLAAGAYVVAIGIVMAVLPSLGELADNVQQYGHHATETPLPLTDDKGAIVYPGFPADTLFSFRFYSVAAQLLLWATVGLVFGPMAERLLDARTAAATAPATAGPEPVGAV
ncbi:CbtA family protein [Kitasatospora sp. NPDC057936]|uniref:CbtA family protein n=1 Tax=Kitasatospora sp. NPDC057936 TaxID=3346283 RepID=UPI0036D8145F